MTRTALFLVAVFAWCCGIVVGMLAERTRHRCERPVTVEDFKP